MAGTPVDDAATRRARIWGAVYLAYMLLTIYWAMTTTGPALWLARAQAAVFGGMYSMKFSVLLLNLPAFLLFAWLSSRSDTPPARPATGSKPRPST